MLDRVNMYLSKNNGGHRDGTLSVFIYLFYVFVYFLHHRMLFESKRTKKIKKFANCWAVEEKWTHVCWNGLLWISYLAVLSAGGTSWVASDYSSQAVQTVRLFRAAAGLVCCTLSLLAEGDADSEAFGEDLWDRLATAVTTTLLPILSANNDLQHYNVGELVYIP